MFRPERLFAIGVSVLFLFILSIVYVNVRPEVDNKFDCEIEAYDVDTYGRPSRHLMGNDYYNILTKYKFELQGDGPSLFYQNGAYYVDSVGFAKSPLAGRLINQVDSCTQVGGYVVKAKMFNVKGERFNLDFKPVELDDRFYFAMVVSNGKSDTLMTTYIEIPSEE